MNRTFKVNQAEEAHVNKYFKLKRPSRQTVGIGLLGVLTAVIIFAVGFDLAYQEPGLNLASVESRQLGNAIGTAVEPTFKKVISDGNETREKVGGLSKGFGDFETRFKQAIGDLGAQIKEIKSRQADSDELIKGIQEKLKTLPATVPLSLLLDLKKEVAQSNANFRLGATA
jgi:hypothetical protein